MAEAFKGCLQLRRLGLVVVAFHGVGHDAIHGKPPGLDLLGEIVAQARLERLDERLSDNVVVRCLLWAFKCVWK